ncbi:MAG: NO-inducible flavohemoprotein [Burkholderiales bacterium]|nr:NO-inducible flavohemoprotein [Burkholderiales bacterium]
MLSTSARPYIDASVPVLREHGIAITRHFYSTMLGEMPELKNLFNMGNQANGAQQQSLAAAVFAYAANIDNASAIAPVLERIVHKHASVGIKPAHYPIVGRYLLGAIAHVLGSAATPALLAAWDEAYWLLAGELIAAESRLYQRSGFEAGEMMSLKVIKIVNESDNVMSFYLQTLDGKSPGDFKPGQYISIAMQVGDLRQLRQYSLSDAPQQPWWRISVKRERASHNLPEGQISTMLHEDICVGDTLQVSAAYGDFAPTLAGEKPLVLISGGIGITPMMAVLNALCHSESRRPILFLHAARNSQHHALRTDLAYARTAYPQLRMVTAYEQPLANDVLGEDYQQHGHLDLASVLQESDLAGDFYLCGPIAFMQAQWLALLTAGIPPQRIHREVFGPELLDHLL